MRISLPQFSASKRGKRPGKKFGLFVLSALTLGVLWIGSGAGNSAPSASAASNVTLRVDASQTVNPFRDTMRGLATNNWNSLFHGLWDRGGGSCCPDGKFEAIVDATSQLEPGILRFGGGLWANRLGWDRSGNAPDDGAWTYRDQSTGRTYNYTHAYKPALVDSYQTLRNQVGPNGGPAQAIIQVNVCDNNIKMWQDLVRYANIEKGYGFEYWEIGNEQTLESCGLNAQSYAQRYAAYQSALKAIDPSIKVMGPINHQPYYTSWEDELVDEMGTDLDVLTWHWYQLSEWTSSANSFAYQGGSLEGLMAHDGVVGSACQSGFGCPNDGSSISDGALNRWTYRRGIAEQKMDYIQDNYVNTGDVRPDMETAITEFGVHASQHEHPINGNHVGAVWLADMLPRWAYNGLDIVTYYSLEDGGNGGGSTNSRGLIGTWGSSSLDIRPTYYAEWLLANHFGDTMVQSSTSDPDQKVVVWATKDSNDPGKLKLMLVNLSGDNASARLQVSGFTPRSGQAYVMTSDNPLSMADSGSFTNHSTKINGVRIPDYQFNNPSGFNNAIDSIRPVNVSASNDFSYSIPPYSAVALELSGDGAQSAPAAVTTSTPTQVAVQNPVSDTGISVSQSASRNGGVGLDGATVSGDIYVSVAPDSDVSSAAFYVDDPSMSGSPRRTEYVSAYDLMGTAVGDGSALPFDTTGLSNGSHSVTVRLVMRDGSTRVHTAPFTVSNSGGARSDQAQTPSQSGQSVIARASYNADRSAGFTLNGATVSGEIYAWAGPDANVSSVSFYVDDTAMSGAPHQVESLTPFDLEGTTFDGRSLPFNTWSLANGAHRLTMRVTLKDGQQSVVTSTFNVSNAASSAAPTPTSTPTPAPSQVPTPAAPSVDSVDLMVGYTQDRARGYGLNGAMLRGQVFIWADAEPGVSEVRFYVDNKNGAGEAFRVDNAAPFDMGGQLSNGAALPVNVSSFGPGYRTVTVRATMADGSQVVRHATFLVTN